MDWYIFLGHTPRSGSAESNGNSTSDILKNCQTIFQSGCVILQSHQEWMRFPTSPRPVMVHLVMQWCLTGVLSHICRLTNDTELLFRYLLAIWISLKKCPFRFFGHLFIVLFFFLFLSFILL